MEPALPQINHIPCSLHREFIRRVSINNDTDLSLLCISCIMEGKQDNECYTPEKLLEQIAQSSKQIPKLQQLPDTTSQILLTENEILASFSFHIEKQKEAVNAMVDKLRQSVYQKLENKKRQLTANLESQLKAFEDALAFYKQKIFSYKEDGPKQAEPATFESLYKEVSKLTNAADLKKLLATHYENMKNNEIFTHVKPEIAVKLVTDAIEAMDAQIMKLQTSRPTVLYGGNNSPEEILQQWNDQVDTAINALKLDIKDPVKPIEFRLGVMNFDSVILKDDPENQKIIANWVLETIKSNHYSFNLLYRGSRDGFRAKDFHGKCDYKGPTLVIIENTIGNKFGGYAPVAWTSTSQWVQNEESRSSFLFSIDKKQKLSYQLESKQQALYHGSDYGPVFGYGPALCIRDRCNTSSENNCEPSKNTFQNLKEGGYISGTNKFIVKEIEVYSLAPL